jgi:choline monooxygenase
MTGNDSTLTADPGYGFSMPSVPDFMEGAACLPARAYTDPRIHEAELEACFKQRWVSIGSASQVGRSGDMVALTVAGEPLLITRDKADEIRVFYNVCRHRGLKLVVDDGASRCGTGIINCPYHMWGYGLDGRLRSAPFLRGEKQTALSDQEKQDMGLLPVRSTVWCGTIFINLSGEAEPFEDFIRPLAERWAGHDLSLLRHITTSEWSIESNWKFAVDNFLDVYHLPWVHTALGAPELTLNNIGYNYLSDEIFGYMSPDFDRGRDAYEMQADMFPGLTGDFEYGLDLMYLFPNTLMLVGPNWAQVISILPDQPGHIRELLNGYVVGDGMTDAKWDGFRAELEGQLRIINEQDCAVLKALQLGRVTDATDQGQYAKVWDQLSEKFAMRIRALIGKELLGA